jgi:hypothetical protein
MPNPARSVSLRLTWPHLTQRLAAYERTLAVAATSAAQRSTFFA